MSAMLSPRAAQEILLAAVLLRDARDGRFLAVLLALFQTVFYGLPVAAVVYYVLRRRRGRRRANASRDDTYGDARFAPLAAEFAEPNRSCRRGPGRAARPGPPRPRGHALPQ